jgi:hypothetical protein
MLILCRVILILVKQRAPIVYGPTAKTEFDSIIANDQEFQIGKIKIKAYTLWSHHGDHLFIIR